MLERDYDLINELGPQNWIDAVAGEAVVMGFVLRKPELEMKGTALAKLAREIQYNSDDFGRVEAMARSIKREIETMQTLRGPIKIDELYFGDERFRRSSVDWEFQFVFEQGRYQIQIILPVYYGNDRLNDGIKLVAETIVKNSFEDPSFGSYQYDEVVVDYVIQTMKISNYRDNTGKLLRRVIDHSHEDGYSRGIHDTYYFDDFVKATNIWREISRSVIGFR